MPPRPDRPSQPRPEDDTAGRDNGRVGGPDQGRAGSDSRSGTAADRFHSGHDRRDSPAAGPPATPDQASERETPAKDEVPAKEAPASEQVSAPAAPARDEVPAKEAAAEAPATQESPDGEEGPDAGAGRNPAPECDSEPGTPETGTAKLGAQTPAIGPEDGQEDEDDDEVTVVPGVARYHRGNCILIRFLGMGDLDLTTRAQARAAGCAPCRACQPDEPQA